MQKYQDVIFGTSSALAGGVQVQVNTYPAGTPATIYSDNGVTTQANPITTDSYGRFSFYAADGRYQLVISGTYIVTQTINDILLEDPANASAVAISGGTINATPIGATSASSGVFTTLSVTGAASFSTGPTAPTAPVATSTTQVATTAFATPRTGTTGATMLPAGTTAQRDAAPAAGYTRFNTDLGKAEVWDNASWKTIADGTDISNTKTALASDNPVINGEHLAAQAATSGTLTAGGSTTSTTYTTDMHHAWCTGANVAWAQVAVGQLGFKNGIQFTGAVGVTGIGHGVRIEAVNSAPYKGKNIAVPVRMYNSLLTSVTWAAYSLNVADAFGTNGSGAKTQVATGTLTLTAADTTLRDYLIKFTDTGNADNGYVIEFSVGAQISGVWLITGEDMVEGTASRQYPHLTYDRVLTQCQRYYQLNCESLGYAVSATVITVLHQLPVPMRIAPTPILLTTTPAGESPWYTIARTGTASTLGSFHLSASSVAVQVTGFSGLTVNTQSSIYGGQIAYNARL